MPDPRLMSVHLEGLPRRDLFRTARDRVRAACGTFTLPGDGGPPADPLFGPPADGDTALAPPGALIEFWLKDGDTVYPLTVGVNSVGRMGTNAVCVRDEHVSRHHCAVIIHRDGRAEVHDVASKNGTVVNGHRITSATRLRPGDQLTLCARKLTFLAGPPEPAVAEPTRK